MPDRSSRANHDFFAITTITQGIALMTITNDEIVTDSGIAIAPVYREVDRGEPEPDPGVFPYTRGIYPTMYRGRRWTMRQYAGFSSVEESNARYRLLLGRGTTGLSVAFDLPTQLGLDSDDERACGEVGRVGVPISTVDDMRRLFDGIDQAAVTTSMTINAPAALLLLMYEIVAEERGVDPASLGGTIQNDILKEYAARGTYIFPPRPSMRLVTDTFAYCAQHLPSWNTISISGYHMREAGSSAAQEIAFTIANGLAYVEAAIVAGLTIDQVAPRMSFFFSAHSDLFEEVAKFRAVRRLWARLIRERYAPRDQRSEMIRFHTQTGGVTLTAQQPLNNVVRVAYQALSAVLGGTQSLHTNSFDEALGLPTQDAATLALRTQQILAEETGIARTADPLAGSYFVERLTDEVEERRSTGCNKWKRAAAPWPRSKTDSSKTRSPKTPSAARSSGSAETRSSSESTAMSKRKPSMFHCRASTKTRCGDRLNACAATRWLKTRPRLSVPGSGSGDRLFRRKPSSANERRPANRSNTGPGRRQPAIDLR
jgi:methylmalonyl-CoA mutase N-terminal domain/subunit